MRWTPERVARLAELWGTEAFWQDIWAEINALPGDPIPRKGQILRQKAMTLALKRPMIGGALIKEFSNWRRNDSASYHEVEAVVRACWADPSVTTQELMNRIRSIQAQRPGRPAITPTKSGLHMLARSLGLGPRGGSKPPIYVATPEDRDECGRMVERGKSDAEMREWFGWDAETLEAVINSLPAITVPPDDVCEAEALYNQGYSAQYIMGWFGWNVETWAVVHPQLTCGRQTA